MKILIVDDSPVMRHVIRQELEQGEHEVIEASNGADGLKIMLTTPIDLITLDVDMPELNGYETCQALRSDKYSHIFRKGIYKKIPIIFITGMDTIEARKKGFEVGACDFITKPFKEGNLLAIVNRLLQPQNKLKGLTALVVDDSDVAREVTTTCLIEQGVTVLEAKDGEEGLGVIKEKAREIDMLITDQMMPKMNGDELCMKVRKESGLKDLPIIFLTAVSEKQSVLDLFKVGATDYVIKPFVKEELIARINVHLEVRLLNKNLKKNIEEFTQLAKLRDDFLTICSHDFRSPLNNILGFTDLLLNEEYIKEVDKENLLHIKTSSEVLLTLINDILDLDRPQSVNEDFKVSSVSLVKVAESSIATLKHVAKPKDIEVKLENKAKKDDKILGNASFLVRAIDNLLSNAIKFTLKGGEVRVVIEPHLDNQLAISIIDNGMGILEQNIPVLFDKSSVIVEGEDGMGRGLPIVKKIVDKHGGRIEVSSQQGKGANFKIVFPKIKG
ncbi:MAG: response regulator [bacterium]